MGKNIFEYTSSFDFYKLSVIDMDYFHLTQS